MLYSDMAEAISFLCVVVNMNATILGHAWRRLWLRVISSRTVTRNARSPLRCGESERLRRDRFTNTVFVTQILTSMRSRTSPFSNIDIVARNESFSPVLFLAVNLDTDLSIRHNCSSQLSISHCIVT